MYPSEYTVCAFSFSANAVVWRRGKVCSGTQPFQKIVWNLGVLCCIRQDASDEFVWSALPLQKHKKRKVQLSPQKQNLEPHWYVEVLLMGKAGASGSRWILSLFSAMHRISCPTLATSQCFAGSWVNVSYFSTKQMLSCDLESYPSFPLTLSSGMLYLTL